MVSPQPALGAEHVFGALEVYGTPETEGVTVAVLREVVAAFAGERPDYYANDMRYHDIAHTLRATVCAADLLAGQARSGEMAGFTLRTAELTIVAALLHDAGFLKLSGDLAGTGAKYTWVHEQRSCDFARMLLPALAVAPWEIEAVCSAIACTGPRNRISAHSFPTPTVRRMASLLVTADYLSQMSAPDYPAKLEALYAEFVEAFEHDAIPVDQCPYRSATDLKRQTEAFWQDFVRPMLDSEAEGVHRFLSLTGQPNPYLAAVQENVAVIRRLALEELRQS